MSPKHTCAAKLAPTAGCSEDKRASILALQSHDACEACNECAQACQEVAILLALRGECVGKVDEAHNHSCILWGLRISLIDDQHRRAARATRKGGASLRLHQRTACAQVRGRLQEHDVGGRRLNLKRPYGTSEVLHLCLESWHPCIHSLRGQPWQCRSPTPSRKATHL